MQWSDDSHRFDVRLRGAITFTDDLTDVQTLSDGGLLTLRDWSGVIPHTVEIASSNGTLTRSYFVAGLKRPWDEEGRRLLAAQLPLLVLRTGLGAESRVKDIFARRGATGVLSEIDRLGGDHARRLYFVALINIARFDSTSLTPVFDRVGRIMSSDYERRIVLEQIAARVDLDRAGAAAYLHAMATMKSDYEQRQAISALTRLHRAVVDGEALLPVLAHMKSSYDKRMVLQEIVEHKPLSDEAKHTVLAAVAGMTSDYDRRQVLTEYIDRFGVEPSVRAPFFAAVRAVKSNYDRREILTRLAKSGASGRDVQEAVFGALGDMTSDYDRAEVLLAFAPAVDATSRPAFVSAAGHIRSSHDQNRVLAALVKAEHR
jgi:hypothetical protein